MKFKNFVILASAIVIILQFAQILYGSRNQFITKYDPAYWKERVEYSQWYLPLSKRIIGDDGLYAYVGYELINGASPAFFNAEMPPLGKYLIGVSIYLFGSQAFYGLFFGIGTQVVFFLLCKKIIKNLEYSLLTTAVFSLDPLFFTQLWHSWLDIAQVFFLLLNTFLIVTGVEKKNVFLITLSGVCLGLFSTVKPPILLPLVLSLEILFIFLSKQKKLIIHLLLATGAGLLIPYLQFFMQGNNLLEFIKLQKYMVSFYLLSDLVTNIASIWPALLLGKIAHINSGYWENVSEWWAAWPLILVGGAFVIYKEVRDEKNILIIGSGSFIFLTLLIYSFIPIYARYLLLIMPFLYMLFFVFISRFKKSVLINFLVFTLIIYGLFNTFIILEKESKAGLMTFMYSFENQYFRDVYFENLSIDSKNKYRIKEFYLLSKTPMNDAEIVGIEFDSMDINTPRFSGKGEMKVKIIYKTRYLGEFSENKTVNLVKENGVWKIDWDWSYLFADFKQNYKLDTSIIPGRRGNIIGTKDILANNEDGFLISVNPSLIDTSREEELLKLISSIGGVKPINLKNAYLENVIPNTYVPLATNVFTISSRELDMLQSYKGVMLEKHPTRVFKGGINYGSIVNTFFEECCTRIYSNYAYHGVDGLEKKYDNVLSGSDGGTLIMYDDKGNPVRMILSREPVIGKDIEINY